MVLNSLDAYIKYHVNRFDVKVNTKKKKGLCANKRYIIFMLCLTFWSTPIQFHVLAFVN